MVTKLVKVFCDCKDWEEGMRQLEGFTMLAHHKGIPYTAKIFKWCPWCGKRLDKIGHYRGSREGIDEFGRYCKLKEGGI